MKQVRFAFIIIMTLLLCACVPKTEEGEATAPEPEIVNVTPLPATLQEAPAPSVTPGFSINPVSAFYARYTSDTRSAFEQYRQELSNKSGVSDIRTLLDFNEHCTFVLYPNASIGRLCASGGAYSDTLLGAAKGSGTLTPKSSAGIALAGTDSGSSFEDTAKENLEASDEDFLFSFTYNGGYVMRGYLRSDILYYAVFPVYSNETIKRDIDEETGKEAEIISSETLTGDFLYGAYLQRLPGEQWHSLVLRPGSASMLLFENRNIAFSERAFDPELLPSLQALPFESLCAFVETGSIQADAAGSDGQLT